MVLIEYTKTGERREVAPIYADILEKAGAAHRVLETREMKAEDISPRTGKQKRRYKRRDLRAED